MWSDNQKRIACRLAFLLLCALPTAATVYQILHPQTAADWQRQIQSQLGVKTRITSVETPGPYETVLRGLTFLDADNRPILDATELRILFGETNRIEIDHSVQLTSDGLQHILGQINERLVRSHAVTPQWSVYLRSAIVESSVVSEDHFGSPEPRKLWLEHLVLDTASNPQETVAQLEFNLVNQTAPTPAGAANRIRCGLRREKLPAGTPGATPHQLVKLDTGTDALPCWLVSNWLPQIATSLGQEASFSGRLQVDAGSPDLPGEAWGHFYNVQLHSPSDTTTAANLASRQGTIEVEHFQFQSGDVQHVAYLSVPNSGTTRVRIETPIEMIQQFDFRGAIRNATLRNERQISAGTLRR